MRSLLGFSLDPIEIRAQPRTGRRCTTRTELVFYNCDMPDPFKVTSRCCKNLEFVYTVPLRLPATEEGWQSLCADCFRDVLHVEPSDDLTLQPLKHPHR